MCLTPDSIVVELLQKYLMWDEIKLESLGEVEDHKVHLPSCTCVNPEEGVGQGVRTPFEKSQIYRVS